MDELPHLPIIHRQAALAKLGYKMKTAASATLSAAAFDPQTRECRAAMR